MRGDWRIGVKLVQKNLVGPDEKAGSVKTRVKASGKVYKGWVGKDGCGLKEGR